MHIKPGDALTRRKFGFWGYFYQHWALYLQDEEPQVIEKQDIGVRQISFRRFHKYMPYTVIPYTGPEPRKAIANRALEKVDDKRFYAPTDNCESFVKYCQTGKFKWSKQVVESLVLIGLTVLFFIVVIISY